MLARCCGDVQGLHTIYLDQLQGIKAREKPIRRFATSV